MGYTIFMNLATAKISVRPRKNTAEGGCGGNSAVFLQKIEASPATLLVQSRTQQKSFLFLLEEKTPARAKSEMQRNLFCWVASASERRRAGFLGLVSFKNFG